MGELLAIVLAFLLPFTAPEPGTTLKDTKDCWMETVHLRVVDNLLYMTMDDRESYQPVAVREGFVEAVRALEESGERYRLDPDDMDGKLLQLLDDSLTGGRWVLQMDVHAREIVLLLEGPGESCTLRIAEWNGSGYDVLDNETIPAGSVLDTTHMYNNAYVWMDRNGELEVGLNVYRDEDGSWRMASKCRDYEEDWEVEWWGIFSDDVFAAGSNEGVYYGEFPANPRGFAETDVTTIPVTLEDGLARLDRSGWAVVNNPNPADRLHLRAAPDRDAKSLGRFYNRTPVQVVGSEGEWTEVIIGEEGLTGWMMTEYLAFGEDMDAVACAFPQDVEPEGDQLRWPVRSVPDEGAEAAWETTLRWDSIIGVAEDQWYIIMAPGMGRVGYVLQSWFVPKSE